MKRQLFRGSHRRRQARLCYHTLSPSSLRNINLIPFWPESQATTWTRELSFALGSSNPWPNAVLMEPFSTSVFKVLIWIVATTTKICTRHGSTESHDRGFCTVPTPSYSLRRHLCRTVVEYRQRTWASSIFRANSFGRWVVTHSLAGSDFHGHRPAVFMNQHLLWCLMSPHLDALTRR